MGAYVWRMSGITWFTRAEGGPTQVNKCAFSIRRLLNSKGNRKRGSDLKLVVTLLA